MRLCHFRALERKFNGLVRLDDLKRRPSHRLLLDQLIGHYAVSEDAELRERLTHLLRHAAERSGPPGDQSDLSDPRLMAAHALSLVDPANGGKFLARCLVRRSLFLPDGGLGMSAIITDSRYRGTYHAVVSVQSRGFS